MIIANLLKLLRDLDARLGAGCYEHGRRLVPEGKAALTDGRSATR